MTNLMVSFNLPRTLPGCHGNEIWDKIGYNSAYLRDICEIFVSVWWFSGMMDQRMLPIEFYSE